MTTTTCIYVSQTKCFLQKEVYILVSSAPVNLKVKFGSETLFFLFSFEQFCAAVQTSMLLWKSNIIYSEGELTFLITHISEIPHVDKYCFSLCLDSLYKDLFCVTEFLSLVWERYMNMLISQKSRIIQCKLIIILIPLVSYKELLKVNI